MKSRRNGLREKATPARTTLRGRPWKTRKCKLETPKRKVASASISSQDRRESKRLSGQDFAILRNSPVNSLTSTPKRGRGQREWTQEDYLTSTPVHHPSTCILSKSTSGTEKVKLEYTQLITDLKTSEVDSPCPKSSAQSRGITQERQIITRSKKKRKPVCSKNHIPVVKKLRGRPRKIEIRDRGTTTTRSSRRSRPRFELEKLDPTEQDLSIDLSHQEEELKSFFQEDESIDEEEELPSFLMQTDKQPQPIAKGMFVWHKFRNYPSWPALVKSVTHRQKKASILFIDDPVLHKKGIVVALKTLKPFDCEEANELVHKAKETHDAAIDWSLEIIKDYTIRIACGSFSGSFSDYLDHDMSYPVRRKYPHANSQRPSIASDETGVLSDHEEDQVTEQQENIGKRSRRLLPDRSYAAHNRANEKLVHFIVNQRMVEGHLLAVIREQQPSRWLRDFLRARRTHVVSIYLEDDRQLDQVYCYLRELYSTAVASTSCVTDVMARVSFVLDVLLPEAIINAIAGVNNVSVKEAEQKYLQGRRISNRERQEFEEMIERQKHFVSDPMG